jgi:uncharacterized protein YjbJ (UPF0337 family)
MKDILKERWAQLREPIKKWWDKLDEYDLDEINGNHDFLVSKLQEKYGYDTKQAELEVKQRLDEFQREYHTMGVR